MTDILHTPRDARDLAHTYVERVRSQASSGTQASFGVSSLDNYLNGLKPGDLVVVLARPSNGKTQMLLHLARTAAFHYKIVQDRNTFGPPIFVSFETDIESLYVRDVSYHTGIDSSLIYSGQVEDWDAVHDGVDMAYDKAPIFYMGHSSAAGRKRPRITLQSVWDSVDYAVDKYQFRPSLLCFDYLQLMKLDRSTRDRRLDLAEIVSSLKDMALVYNTPVILASQAGRDVDSKAIPAPDLSSGKETGAIEETADVVLGLMRPARYFPIGENVPGSSAELVVTEELFFTQVLKQRNGPVGKGFWLHFDMTVGRLSDIDLVTVDLNDY